MPELRQTNENLCSSVATAPMMKWLVCAALEKSVLTYGQAKSRLETEVGFSPLARAGRTGHTAGAMIKRVLEIEPKAPLLNILLVEQATELPSDGAGSFLAERFNQPLLAQIDAKNRYHKLWRSTFDLAAGEVYAYSAEAWSDLFERAFGTPYPPSEIQAELRKRRQGAEQDGLPSGRHGEGENHKALRLWVKDNPASIHKNFRSATTATEVDLLSGDRVDVVYSLSDKTIVIEVKSRDSNKADLMRGVYQCIKYRAVQEATDIRQEGHVEAMLITEERLPGDIAALLELHGIAHFQAPKDRT